MEGRVVEVVRCSDGLSQVNSGRARDWALNSIRMRRTTIADLDIIVLAAISNSVDLDLAELFIPSLRTESHVRNGFSLGFNSTLIPLRSDNRPVLIGYTASSVFY